MSVVKGALSLGGHHVHIFHVVDVARPIWINLLAHVGYHMASPEWWSTYPHLQQKIHGVRNCLFVPRISVQSLFKYLDIDIARRRITLKDLQASSANDEV